MRPPILDPGGPGEPSRSWEEGPSTSQACGWSLLDMTKWWLLDQVPHIGLDKRWALILPHSRKLGERMMATPLWPNPWLDLAPYKIGPIGIASSPIRDGPWPGGPMILRRGAPRTWIVQDLTRGPTLMKGPFGRSSQTLLHRCPSKWRVEAL